MLPSGEVPCVFHMIHTLVQEVQSISHNPCSITPEDYFDPAVDLEGKDIGRPKEQTTKTQKFKANLWLSENYPLSLPEQVIVSQKNPFQRVATAQ